MLRGCIAIITLHPLHCSTLCFGTLNQQSSLSAVGSGAYFDLALSSDGTLGMCL